MGEQTEANHNPTSPIQQAIGNFDSFDDVLHLTQTPQESSPLSPSLPPPSFLTSNQYSTTNAVHMEVQENAKIPTFNISIDRSNSVNQQRNSGWTPATQHAVDEMFRLSENDLNLTEMFLQSNDRSSTNMAYSNTGKLLDNIGDEIKLTESSSANQQKPDFPLLTPTFGPLSGRDSPHLPPLLSPTGAGSKLAPTAPLPAPFSTTTSNQSYYPYGRSLPLPMTKAPSPEGPKSFIPAEVDSRPIPAAAPIPPAANISRPPPAPGDPLAVAIATAAAIACQQNDTPNDSAVLKDTPTVVNNPRLELPVSVNTTSVTSAESSSFTSTTASGTASASNVAASTGSHTINKTTATIRNTQTIPQTALPPPSTVAKPPPSVPKPVTISNTAKTQPIQIQTNLKPGQAPPKSAIPVEHIKTATSTTRKPSGVQTSYYRPPANVTRPLPVARAAAPSGSIVEATKRRSQFGFGGNHVVPSVPLPPPTTKSNAAASRAATAPPPTMSKKDGPRQTNKQSQLPPLPAPPAAISACAAYERKKQRAKNARVKLNDSIERLAVAISLGGTQSRERGNQLTSILSPPPTSKLAELRAETMQIIADCEQSSESAKKWDRPSFVGAAATLLQGLNSQCDALMRELAELKKHNGSTPTVVMSTPQTTAEVSPLVQASESTVEVKVTAPLAHTIVAPTMPIPSAKRDSGEKRTEHPASSEPKTLAASSAKRQKIENLIIPEIENGVVASLEPDMKHADDNNGEQPPALISGSSSPADTIPPIEVLESPTHSVFTTSSTMRSMSSFMDPQSLSRCSAVSKRWKDLNLFQDDGTWLELCLQRYGMTKVRRWKDNDGGDEENGSYPTTKSLYQRMDASNVMPPCQCLIGPMIGESRLPGVASAWVYLVERSNGETLRSVQKKNNSSNPTVGQSGYTSLSVVELRILVQNIGISNGPILLKDQTFVVDASTRRKGEKMFEIDWDERLHKRVLSTDGSPHTKCASQSVTIGDDICRLRLFQSALFVVNMHARGCSTSNKFRQRAKSVKMLLTVNGITTPLVIPFATVNRN